MRAYSDSPETLKPQPPKVGVGGFNAWPPECPCGCSLRRFAYTAPTHFPRARLTQTQRYRLRGKALTRPSVYMVHLSAVTNFLFVRCAVSATSDCVICMLGLNRLSYSPPSPLRLYSSRPRPRPPSRWVHTDAQNSTHGCIRNARCAQLAD